MTTTQRSELQLIIAESSHASALEAMVSYCAENIVFWEAKNTETEGMNAHACAAWKALKSDLNRALETAIREGL